MNKYKKLIELIENNGLEIQSKKCYDPQSAWHGEELWIIDKKGQNKIFDLSGNGYCFHDDKVDEAVEEVEKYLSLKNMNTFDAFKEWVEKNAKPQKNAQKGVKHVYLGMGINRFWVVGVLLVIRFNCRNYSCDFNRFQKQKVGDPTS